MHDMVRDAPEQARVQERQARWMGAIVFIVALGASILLQ